MHKVVIATALTIAVGTASAQVARQARAGEMVRLREGLTLKVSTGAKTTFDKVKLKGTPFVVVLDLDAGDKETSLSYQLAADAKTSDVYLISGNQRFAPRAVVEDFPSWGTDNDKEVELVDAHDKGAASLNFRKAGSLSILFDLPADQAATQKKLSVIVRTLKPTEAEHSFVVSL